LEESVPYVPYRACQLLLAPKALVASSGAHNHTWKRPERDSWRRDRPIVFDDLATVARHRTPGPTRPMDARDYAWAAGLMERRRPRYAEFSPVFWRPAPGVTEMHAQFMEATATREGAVAFPD